VCIPPRSISVFLCLLPISSLFFDAIDGGSSHLWFNIAGKP
jgi:hypothetical protein